LAKGLYLHIAKIENRVFKIIFLKPEKILYKIIFGNCFRITFCNANLLDNRIILGDIPLQVACIGLNKTTTIFEDFLLFKRVLQEMIGSLK
jgi:hypothetical protein